MKSVLIVDDNELVRNLIETILKDAGFDVLTAASGIEAIELVSRHRHKIACVLQDLSMPLMQGEQVVSELHELEPDLPIIVLSVDDAAYSASRLSGLRIAGYIQKPFDPNLLVTKVSDVIRGDPGPSD